MTSLKNCHEAYGSEERHKSAGRWKAQQNVSLGWEDTENIGLEITKEKLCEPYYLELT